jgi:hypothetical protein
VHQRELHGGRVSMRGECWLFAFLCMNGSFMVVEFLCGVSVGPWLRGGGFSQLPSAGTSTVDHPLGSPSLLALGLLSGLLSSLLCSAFGLDFGSLWFASGFALL